MTQNPFPELLDTLTDEQPESTAPATGKKFPCIIAIIAVILLGIIAIVCSLHSPFDPEDLVEVSMPEMVKTGDLGKLGWSKSSNTYTGLPILVKTPDPELITLEFHTDHGSLWHIENSDEIVMFQFGTELGDRCTVPSDHAVYWKDFRYMEDGTYTSLGLKPTNYIRVLLKTDEHIVGYVVLSTRWPFYKDSNFELATLEYRYYPIVNGQYQQIPESYVQAEMDRVIAEAESAYLAKQAAKPQFHDTFPAYLVHEAQRFDLTAADCAGVPILLDAHDHDGLMLEYQAQDGSLFYDPSDPSTASASSVQYFGQRCTVGEDHYIYWQPYQLADDGSKIPVEEKNRYSIAVIFRDGEHIIGCCIIFIDEADGLYTPENLRKMVYFQKTDGQYQTITEEYVMGWIDAYT